MLKRIKSAVLPSSTKGLVVGLMVAALLVVTAGFVVAQSSPDNTIYGCSDKKTGLLRIVASTSSCTTKETAISWNQVGPQGLQGEQGLTGAKGDTGETGPPGPQGERGAQGEQGLPGEKGETGATGETGPKGDQGPQGLQGEKGDKGEQGLTGAQGPPGEKGAQGEQGLQGEQGATGAKGEKGDTGATGPQGPQGEQGPKGEQGLKGDTGPQGPQGEPGAKGETGQTGPAGPQGDTGAQGPMGPPGPQGEPGPQGPSGTSNAYVTGPNDRILTPGFQELATLLLPSGDDGSKYLVSVSMNLQNTASTATRITCLGTGGGFIGPFRETLGPSTPTDGTGTMTATFPLLLRGGSALFFRFQCTPDAPGVHASSIYMTALPVENWTNQ